MADLIQTIRDILWGPQMIIFVLGTGLYLTFKLRGIQFRQLFFAFRQIGRRKGEGDIPPFQSLMTALAATVGIGNIGGVATALATGGLGALVWMVIVALVGMATSYTEAFLAVRFRVKDKNGEMAGGPMYTIARGLGWRWLAFLFAGAGALAAFASGNMVQSNSIADVLVEWLPFDRLVIGAGLAVLVGLVILGGIKKIGKVAGFLVPLMATVYIGAGLFIIGRSAHLLPEAVGMIFRAAFTGQAAFGGFLGASFMLAVRMGVSRGLSASEAGIGTSPIAAAAAQTDRPGRQAMVSMTGAFLSVCCVCVITGLTIAISGVLGQQTASGAALDGVPLTMAAFARGIPGGHVVVMVSALLFGYTTILGWAYYGERCAEYVLGKRAVRIYRILFTLAVVPGALLHLHVAWNLNDIANAMMVIPNLISLIALAGLVRRETKVFLLDEEELRLAA